VKHELPAKEKASHAEVKYEHPSMHAGRYCGNCNSLIEAPDGNRCKTVVEPIYLNGWCKRWPGKK
jgi:High potential iron-sulfur protein